MKTWLFSGMFLIAIVALSAYSPPTAYADSGWKPYLDLVKKGDGVKSAGIFGQDGATWLADAELKLPPAEVKALVEGIKDNTKFTNGILAAKVKYVFLRAPADNQVIGRKGPTTLLLITTMRSLIVVTTKDGANPGNITSHEFVANDLIKKGF